MKFRTLFLMLAAFFAIRLFIASTTPVFDTSEARYAAISANMARTGDFLVPRFTYRDVYQSFDGKPPLLFQLSGLACRTFGVNEFAVRLPVLFATLALLVLIGIAVRRVADPPRALLAAGVCLSSTAYYALAGFCMPDGLLTPCIAAAYCCHFLYLVSGNRNWTLGVFAALGVGMVVKGPVALALFAVPVFLDTCFNHRWHLIRTYRWFTSLALFLALAAPWFILMTRQNPGFLTYFFINENLLRFLVHDYGDKYGAGRETFRGMALVWLFVVTLPWPLFFAPHVRRLKGLKIRRVLRTLFIGSDTALFAWGIAGIVGFWCLTSRVPLPYVMPAVPLFAMLMALKAPANELRKYLPVAALISIVALVGTLAVVRTTSDKMPGADAPYRRGRYSYEFYHGTPDFVKETSDLPVSRSTESKTRRCAYLSGRPSLISMNDRAGSR